jgi:putative protease
MKQASRSKPELLLPAGSVEAFYAALQGGADAVYLGLKDFNARGRATNFSYWQAAAVVKEARKNQVKVYIALNTVIRNNEIARLVDTLFVLTQIKPDAVIVQDWGVFYLIKKHFPQLTVHASTQMANHNSAGLAHAHKMGIKRVVLARELTSTELEQIAAKSKIEIELFIHGALCYSFSGLCLFSSFLGGASANRGQCAQPCRRNYSQNEKEGYFFSLKDNQLLEHLPFIEKLKIDSLKIEGRLKPAEYVFQTASAYRKAIDFQSKSAEAKEQLRFDLGREKTDYFYGKKVSEAITQSSGTGFLLGMVTKVENGSVTFSSGLLLDENCRLRFRNKANDQQTDFNINNLQQKGQECTFQTKSAMIGVRDEVYLAGAKMKFPDKIKTDSIKINDRCPASKVSAIKSDLIFKPKPSKTEIYLRLDRLAALENIDVTKYEGILLNLPKKEWAQFLEKPLLKGRLKEKVILEFPKFIAENDLSFYRDASAKLVEKGFSSFFVSHLSQVELLPKGTRFGTNENVYAFNDSAVKLIRSEGAYRYCYPLENDIVNMAKGTDRDGIVPVYFFPQLFFSRMPVAVEKETSFTDKNGEEFRKLVRDGMTIVIPKNPVSLTLYKNKLERYGFSRYLVDLSFAESTWEQISFVVKRLLQSESITNTSLFNFKRELK